jgi:hypothetical protein
MENQMSNLVAEIRNHFTYENGKLFWKSCSKKPFQYKEAGGIYFATKEPHKPFNRIRLQNKRIPTHHVVWMMFNGYELPKNTRIIHKNGDTLDNRIENLELYDAKSK